MSTPKPLPAIDHLSAPFWEGCQEGRLRLQTCTACRKPQFPPGPVCTHCGSPDSEWIDSSGRASVYSWIVVRHPIPVEVYADDVPYVVALVELEEGVRMPTNIVDCAPEAVSAGMPLEVCFRDVSETITLPQFRPLTANR
jgi:uncharacterized OB-fold protein